MNCYLCEVAGFTTSLVNEDPEHATYVECGVVVCKDCADLLDYEREKQYEFDFDA